MNYDTYTDGAAQLAVDLANTPAADFDGFVASNDEWFTPAVPRRLSKADRTAMTDLGRRVRAVAEAASDADVVDTLNDLLDRCRPAPRATGHDGHLHLHYSADDARLVEQLGATVSMGMAMLVCRYGRSRLGRCAAEDCDDIFIDTSRNRSKRYCSETCASRTTVSAFRARRRAGVGSA